MKKRRIGVFLGDLFWSNFPYDGLELYSYLSSNYDVDLILFQNDIRLNKKFDGREDFYFDVSVFSGCVGLVTVDDWDDFYNLSENYELIITTPKIAPKTRFPRGRKISKCDLAVWDIGGHDILTDAILYADYYFVKGHIWKDWLINLGKKENMIFVTGSPNYDSYLRDGSLENFLNKYSLDKSKKVLLVTPSNPTGHSHQFDSNLALLHEIIETSKNNGYQVLLKTYPHDYVFYEDEAPFSGIYKRKKYDWD